MKQDRRYL